MHPNLLILGGTTQASRLAESCAAHKLNATLSYAGRVERVKPQPIPTRSGGFGGAEGLAQYIQSNNITHLIDATHPFAAQISGNAITAARSLALPYCAFTRPAWQPQSDDDWQIIPSLEAAIDWLERPAMRVMLAIGRQYLSAFEAQPHHHYLLRLVDPPITPPNFPNHQIVISRGPFTLASDLELLKQHHIEVIISKNSGGEGARAKLDAARQLGLQVVMIERPSYPERLEFNALDAVMNWVLNAA